MEGSSPFTPEELAAWQRTLEVANRVNILCYCRRCEREWVASTEEPCTCGSQSVQYIACWQFPDD